VERSRFLKFIDAWFEEEREFEHLPGVDHVLVKHRPTGVTFEIVYDPDHAMIGGLTIHGFAARIYEGNGSLTTEQLAALGPKAIEAFLCSPRLGERW
jgi:hypothetical protein